MSKNLNPLNPWLRWEDHDKIPIKLPLITQYLKERVDDKRTFKNTRVLFIQHQLGCQVAQATTLIKLGLKPDQLYWLDIPYSSNAQVRDYLVNEIKIPKKNFLIHQYNPLKTYAAYQLKRTQDVLIDFTHETMDELIVFDDGAYFLEAMATFKNTLSNVRIIEQTTRGFIKIEGNASLQKKMKEIVMVDVARSKPKRFLEPPFIGTAVCLKLIQTIRSRFDSQSIKILVLGFGAIGQQIVNALLISGISKEQIYVFDKDLTKQKHIKAQKLSLWRREFQTCFHVVIGCSGTTSFTIGDFVYLEDGALLASASSGSVELSREQFIELAATHPSDDIKLLNTKKGLNIHDDLEFQLVDRRATFLNGGFPLNFKGQVNCVPPHYIQSTIVMMIEAARVAHLATKPGLFYFSEDFNHWIDHAFHKILAQDSQMLRRFQKQIN